MKRLILFITFVFFLSGCTIGKPEIKASDGRVSVVCPLSQVPFKDVMEVAIQKELKWYKFNVKNMHKIVSYYNDVSDKANIDPDFIGIFVYDASNPVYMVIVKDACVVAAGNISMNALDVLLNSEPI